MIILTDYTIEYNKTTKVFFVIFDSTDLFCPICNSALKYRDTVTRIMKEYGGNKHTIMIERRQCRNPKCKRIHRCLPNQLSAYKHYTTQVIEDTVDDVVIPESYNEAEEFIESPCLRTVKFWKKWVKHNTQIIEGKLIQFQHDLFSYGSQYYECPGFSLLEKLRSYGGGWLATILPIIYNSGGALEAVY